jgi:GT2 family glycosyltransferase
MPPSASIIFPTMGRRAYLGAALASVASQAREHGAEIVVVHDDAQDEGLRALVEGHGARYIAHGRPLGINVARNTGVDAAAGPLLCFLDDDVEVWPAWLEAILAGARENPRHEVLGGPIRARLEGARLHACGREPLPVTTLDLGPDDTDAQFVWGANKTLRRSAIRRVGRFDPALGGAGDEEHWQRRLREDGGAVRYLARAGVDHRRTGDDVRLRSLARAQYRRGQASRRFDEFKGTAPATREELRVLAGIPATPGRDDFLSGESGTLNRRSTLAGMAADLVLDALALPRRVALVRAAARMPGRRVLAVCIARPERAGTAAAAAEELERSRRHDITVRLAAPEPGAGKWANLNAALETTPPGGYDWLLIFDDDVVLPHAFLDSFLFLAERFGFVLAQPAHRFWSNAAWRVTRRRARPVARRTRFVEIGPVTAIAARAFDDLLPFPDLQMGWGLDAHWGAIAEGRGWPVGVIDATPIRHTRPVAAEYPREAAVQEARAFLANRPYISRDQAQETVQAHTGW